MKTSGNWISDRSGVTAVYNSCQDVDNLLTPYEMAQICENCVTGHLLQGTPKGGWINNDFMPLEAYYASATNNTTTADPHTLKTKKALVLATDIFGLSIDNPKLLADMYAEKCGVDVWVPDFFKGKFPITVEALDPYLPNRVGQNLGTFTTLGRYLALGKAMPKLLPFRPSLQDPWVIDFVAYLRKTYGYGSIGMIGYCWGGGTAVRLATKPGVLNTALAIHPSGDYTSSMAKVIIPIQYGIPEEDHAWDPRHGATIQATWGAKPDAPKHEFIHYEGAVHGFGSRPNLEVPEVKMAWEKLVDDNVRWLKETL